MGKVLFYIACAIFFLYSCASAPVVQPTQAEYEAVQKLRKTIAVVSISDSASSIRGIDYVVTNKVESLLLTRFNVIERQQIEDVLRERHIQGNVDVESSAEIGQILGADYIVIGSVAGTVSSPTMHSKDYIKDDKFNGSIWEEVRSQAFLDIKIIDVSTGSLFKTLSSKGYSTRKQNEITFSSPLAYNLALKALAIQQVISIIADFNDLEESKENLLMGAIDNMVARLGKPLAQTFILEGQVLRVVSEKEIMINLGSAHGIRPGNYLTVWQNEMEIIDPRTGIVVSPRVKKGRVKIAQITSGLTAIAKGSKKVISFIHPGDTISLQY